MLDLKSTTEEKVPVNINPSTKEGKPSKIDGKATVAVSSGNATWQDATDQEIADYETGGFPGLIGFVVSEDTAGVSVFAVSADADLGEGVTTIADSITYTYNDPQAENLGLSSGAPVAKTPVSGS